MSIISDGDFWFEEDHKREQENEEDKDTDFFSLEETLNEENVKNKQTKETKNIEKAIHELPELDFSLPLEAAFQLQAQLHDIDKIEDVEILKDLLKTLLKSYTLQRKIFANSLKSS